uniref:NADH-plastoquinone oxidoreductase subunit 5 n=1 Tax=Keteleeria davidiana TaxID=3324 RepID=A0A8F5AR73_KETDA|nr:NADH-plastoquinone oxidoreductase subunit 5 [Keteleeria davidiana]UWI54168.1 NADH-plastoquinone oxidoreductase subunit 5 [Keteleeria evelyniana var. pendula]
MAPITVTVEIGSELLSPVPFHPWTPDVYEGVRFVLQTTNTTDRYQYSNTLSLTYILYSS